MESYLAPPPPSKGKVVGIDCHPDTFTAAVFVGQTPHDARKIDSRENLSLEALLQWASAQLCARDVILMEAGANSFELCKRLGSLGLRAFVLESCHVGKHAKTYADNDKMAAARIALVYLAGNAPCVWVPDDKTQERRQLLHAYRNAVKEDTAATNSLKGFLNQHGIRLGRHSIKDKKTPEWVASQKSFSDLNKPEAFHLKFGRRFWSALRQGRSFVVGREGTRRVRLGHAASVCCPARPNRKAGAIVFS